METSELTKMPVIGWIASACVAFGALFTGRRLKEMDDHKRTAEKRLQAFDDRLDDLESNAVSRDTLSRTVDKAFNLLRDDISELKDAQAQNYQNILEIVRDRR